MEIYPLHFSTEYYQFYILDSKTKAQTDADDFWCPEADKRRLAIGEGLLGVTIMTYENVTGYLSILLKKPDDILIDAKHIVEASIRIPSGILQIKNCTAYETQFELPIEKGTYRVRITTQKILHSKWEDGQSIKEFVDDYVIEMWRSNFAKPVVLKTFGK
jgi:hypothetical protein